jgi:CheY-like chemotaxis protein
MSCYVLVVDDDVEIRESLIELLQERGYEAYGASDGQEGLEVLRNRKPWHLILLDLMMPVMDGWTMRKAQLADPDLAAIPVVVMSAVPNAANMAREIQAAECLQKPARLPEIVAAVERHC